VREGVGSVSWEVIWIGRTVDSLVEPLGKRSSEGKKVAGREGGRWSALTEWTRGGWDVRWVPGQGRFLFSHLGGLFCS